MNTGTVGSNGLSSISRLLGKSSQDVSKAKEGNEKGRRVESRGVTLSHTLRSHTLSESDLPESLVREVPHRACDITVHRRNEDQAIRALRSSQVASGSDVERDDFVFDAREVMEKVGIDKNDLVREKLDEFIEDMFFAFSKLEGELKGSVSRKELFVCVFSYLCSVINLTGLIRDDYTSAIAWLKFILSGFSAGAMYAAAVMSVITDPESLADKLAELSKKPKAEKIKIAIFMTIVVSISLYSPMLDAFNAFNGVIKLVGGDIADPSTFHQVLGYMAAACNWGAESVLPILLGLRTMSGVESEVREIIYADKDSHEKKQTMAKLFLELLAVYNKSIEHNGNKDNLVLDVDAKKIIIFKALLDELNGSPYLLEEVMKIVHGQPIVRYPVAGRVSGLLKVSLRALVTCASGMGLSRVMALPSILGKLGVSGKVDCAKLLETLKTVKINELLETIKRNSYTAQGVTFVDNISTLAGSLQVFPYAISHSIKGAKRTCQVCRGLPCPPEPLTSNGLKRIWKTTATPFRLGGAVLGATGAFVYTWVASGAIEGAKNLTEAAMCPNVTIPGVDKDEVSSIFYTLLSFGSVILLCMILLGGAPSAWARIADRARLSKKGPNVTTLTAYNKRRQENAEKAKDGVDADTREQDGASMKRSVSGRKINKRARISLNPKTMASLQPKESRTSLNSLSFDAEKFNSEGSEDEVWLLRGSMTDEVKEAILQEQIRIAEKYIVFNTTTEDGAGARMKEQGNTQKKVQDWTRTDGVRFKPEMQEEVSMTGRRVTVTAQLLPAVTARPWDSISADESALALTRLNHVVEEMLDEQSGLRETDV